MEFNEIKKATCLHYSLAHERIDIMTKMKKDLESLGITNIEEHISIPLPHFDKITNFHRLNIANGDLININDVYYDKVNVFNCSLNWYIILKKMQGQSGYFLFYEDDVIIKDMNLFQNIIKTTPSNCNILRISVRNKDYNYLKNYNEYLEKQFEREEYTNNRNGDSGCFILDAKGIDHCCEFIENNGYFPADHMLMNITSNLNVYVAKINPTLNASSDMENINSFIE